WSTSFLNLETSAFKAFTSVVIPCPLSQTSTLIVRASMDSLSGVSAVVPHLEKHSLDNWSPGGSRTSNNSRGQGSSRKTWTLRRSNASISISEDVSIGASLLLSASSHVYSTSMHWMSVEGVGLCNKYRKWKRRLSLLGPHNYLLLDNQSQISHFLAMIEPTQSALGWWRMDSFCDDMTVLLMNPNHNQATMLRSFFLYRFSGLNPHSGGVRNKRG
ncbi:hypothetical protein H5410_061223, partial [Solanum commersonii]